MNALSIWRATAFASTTDAGPDVTLEAAADHQNGLAAAGTPRREWAARAMQAMRAGRLDIAWLWADRLCRANAGSALVDAYLLRSAVLAMQRDHDDAQADLRAAAEIDPLEPAINRVLLSAPIAEDRMAAARRLLGADAPDDRRKAFAALAREGFACVGMIEAAKGRLAARLAWNGEKEITLCLRSDVGDRAVIARADGTTPPPGFRHSARLAFEAPQGALVASLTAPALRAFFEPRSVLFTPPRPTKRRGIASSAETGELLIVVPVYDDRDATRACFESLFAALPPERVCRIVAIDDVSPDAGLSADLDALAAEERITLLRNAVNMGFAGSVNRALALRAAGQDALLLNADTIVPPGAIARLAQHITQHADIGAVTPLSNNGEDTSFPIRFRANPLPSAAEIAAIHTAATRVNDGQAIDMPNGVGFCLYVRGEALDRVGALPQDYGRGYYEDVEFCLGLSEAGYRNVCATDVYVGHHGGRSFGKDKRTLVARNLRRLTARHPSYLAKARLFERSDPLKEPIARIELERLRRARAIDLLLLPEDAPPALARAIATGLRHEHPDLIIARLERTASQLRIALGGGENASPQNIVWRFDVTAALADELAERFSALPLRKAFVPEGERASADIARVLSRLKCNVPLFSEFSLTFEQGSTANGDARPDDLRPPKQTKLAAKRAARDARRSRQGATPLSLVLPECPDYTPPQLKKTGGALAIIGMEGSAQDDALLRTLAASRASADRPWLIIAGAIHQPLSISGHAAVHIGGAIPDAELPRWLRRAGAQALLFANRRWGACDPRFALWRDAGLPVAAFGAEIDETHARALSLAANEAPAILARRIMDWLSAGV